MKSRVNQGITVKSIDVAKTKLEIKKCHPSVQRNEPTPDFKGCSFLVIENTDLTGKGLISNVSYSEDMDILDVISYRKDGFIANDGHIEIAILTDRKGWN